VASKKKTAKKAAPKKPRNGDNELRQTNNGMFSGPRPSYGRYQVGANSTDVLNKSLNKKTK